MTDENQQVENEAEPAPANEVEQAALEAEQTTDDGQAVEQDQEQEAKPANDDAGAPRSKGAERRIRQLTRKFRDSERENKALHDRLESLEKRIGPEPAPPRPLRDDYDTTEDYEDALFDWRDTTKSVPKQEKSVDTKPELVAEQVEIVEAFETELDGLADDAVDIVMEKAWPCSNPMTEFIMASEKRAELAYHLATNQDIAEKISKMSPMVAARELAKVELNIGSKKKPNADSKTDDLAPPISSGKPAGTSSTDDDKMSTAQWVAQRRKQLDEAH